MWQLIRRFSAPLFSEMLAGRALDLNRHGRALLDHPRPEDGDWLQDLHRTLSGTQACWRLFHPLLGRRRRRAVKRSLAVQRHAMGRLDRSHVSAAWLGALAQHATSDRGRRAVMELGGHAGPRDTPSARRQASRLAALLAVETTWLDKVAARAAGEPETADALLQRALARVYRKARRQFTEDSVHHSRARRWLEPLVMAAELPGPLTGPIGKGFPGLLASTGRNLLDTLPEFRWLEGLCEQEGNTAHVGRLLRIRRAQLEAAIRRDVGELFTQTPQTFESDLSWGLFCARNHCAGTRISPCGRLISPTVAD